MPAEELPKYLTIAKKLEERIQAGDWMTGRMPGVRAIAKEQGVSTVTAARALQCLRDSGLVAAVERSGYYCNGKENSQAGAFGLLLRTTPGSWQKATKSLTQGGFETIAQRERPALRLDEMELSDQITARGIQQQVRAAIQAGLKGLFFMPSRLNETTMEQDEQLLEACRTQGLPVVLIERNLRGHDRPLEWDLVGSDNLAAGMRLTNHLLSQGRRRIAFIAGSPISSHDARMAGYLHALFRFFSAPHQAAFKPLVLEQAAGMPTKAAYRDLAERLLKFEADGVVCYQDYTAMGIIMELIARGQRIPDNVAVAGFDNLPVGNAFAIGITTYDMNPEEMARQALQVMRQRLRQPDGKPVEVSVPGTLIVRESTHAEKV